MTKKPKINLNKMDTIEIGASLPTLSELLGKIRKLWQINPKSRIKKNKKKYNRKRAKQNLRKRIKEEV